MHNSRPNRPATRGDTSRRTEEQLQVALDDALSRLGRAEADLVEAREACPSLFASAGERFETYDGKSEQRSLFEYLGEVAQV